LGRGLFRFGRRADCWKEFSPSSGHHIPFVTAGVGKLGSYYYLQRGRQCFCSPTPPPLIRTPTIGQRPSFLLPTRPHPRFPVPFFLDQGTKPHIRRNGGHRPCPTQVFTTENRSERNNSWRLGDGQNCDCLALNRLLPGPGRSQRRWESWLAPGLRYQLYTCGTKLFQARTQLRRADAESQWARAENVLWPSCLPGCPLLATAKVGIALELHRSTFMNWIWRSA